MVDHIQAELSQIEYVTQFATRLTADDVTKFISYLNPPALTFHGVLDGITFISTFQDWPEHNSEEFFRALNSIRPDLVQTASKIQWLTSASAETQSPIKVLARILRTEIDKPQWLIIGTILPAVRKSPLVEDKIRALVAAGYINKDLISLCDLMEDVQRHDVANKIRNLHPSFAHYSNSFFLTRFRKALEKQVKELEAWERNLKQHIAKQNNKVKQMLEDSKSVDLESVFVPLTIINEEPRHVDLEDETTYNEIEYLRQISKNQIYINLVEFKVKLEKYSPTKPQIWCLIGNPGSGKTFLCHMTALRFGRGELPQFSYAVCIPCRNSEWHSMESTRIHEGNPVDSDTIQNWLCLGMPEGPDWVSDLAEHIVETDGQGLLLVIDGMDEFIRDVPFHKTILFFLLTRSQLSMSTILLTSRPGAYFDISSAHSLQINQFFHVLGFSPENRDLYFQIQLEEDSDKMKEWKRLMYLHDEVNQLSLVPVNASLFATLVRESDEVSAQTLTLLYSQLTTYLIRRQLVRMELHEFAKLSVSLSQLHPSVEECLREIGEIAFLGVYSRTLISSKRVTLRVGLVEKSCQCLGLVSEYIQKDSVGSLKKVWSFPHLTLQEFTGCYWLSVASWRDQCLSVRYIVNTPDHFSIFRMVVRFLCGLLTDEAKLVLSIIFKFLPDRTTPLEDMPMYYQLNQLNQFDQFDQFDQFSQFDQLDYNYIPQHQIVFQRKRKYQLKSLPYIMGWAEFTKTFLTLSTLLFECNSNSISNSFSIFNRHLPNRLFFYFDSSIAPNEWECFVRSLKLFNTTQIIWIDTNYISIPQFQLLTAQLASCSIRCLAIKIFDEHYFTISRYTDAIIKSGLPSQTKLSIELFDCGFFDNVESADFLSTLRMCSSLGLNKTELSIECIQSLARQLSEIDNILFYPKISTNYPSLFQQLESATQLTGLHLKRTESYQLNTILPQFSNLQELTVAIKSVQFREISLQVNQQIDASPDSIKTSPDYTDLEELSEVPWLSHLITLTKLTYLNLNFVNCKYEIFKQDYLQVLSKHSQSLRGVVLEMTINYYTRVTHLDELLLSLQCCTGLVELILEQHDRLSAKGVGIMLTDDETIWCGLASSLKCLVYLSLLKLPLRDSGMLQLCKGLMHHTIITELFVQYCSLTSSSCIYLRHLLPTLSHLKNLNVNKLHTPDPNPRILLEKTAKLYSVDFDSTFY